MQGTHTLLNVVKEYAVRISELFHELLYLTVNANDLRLDTLRFGVGLAVLTLCDFELFDTLLHFFQHSVLDLSRL